MIATDTEEGSKKNVLDTQEKSIGDEQKHSAPPSDLPFDLDSQQGLSTTGDSGQPPQGGNDDDKDRKDNHRNNKRKNEERKDQLDPKKLKGMMKRYRMNVRNLFLLISYFYLVLFQCLLSLISLVLLAVFKILKWLLWQCFVLWGLYRFIFCGYALCNLSSMDLQSLMFSSVDLLSMPCSSWCRWLFSYTTFTYHNLPHKVYISPQPSASQLLTWEVYYIPPCHHTFNYTMLVSCNTPPQLCFYKHSTTCMCLLFFSNYLITNVRAIPQLYLASTILVWQCKTCLVSIVLHSRLVFPQLTMPLWCYLCNFYATYWASTVLFMQPLCNLPSLDDALLLACFSAAYGASVVLFLQPLHNLLSLFGALSTPSRQHTLPLQCSFCNLCSTLFVSVALHSWLAFPLLTRPLQCCFYNLNTTYLTSKELYPLFPC